VTDLLPKKAARRDGMDRRRLARADAGTAAGERLAERFFSTIPLAEKARVSGYVPMGDEIDDMVLLARLHALGHVCALPVVVAPGAPLLFRRWRPGDTLVPGVWKIPMPPEDAETVVPDVLLVPLLAFDAAGYRLGYGGGYYDRTLAALRPKGAVAVGVAFSGQQVAAVPHEDHDERLDWVVTERYARPFEQSGVKAP